MVLVWKYNDKMFQNMHCLYTEIEMKNTFFFLMFVCIAFNYCYIKKSMQQETVSCFLTFLWSISHSKNALRIHENSNHVEDKEIQVS